MQIILRAASLVFGATLFAHTTFSSECFNATDDDAYEVAKELLLREIDQNGIFIPDSVAFPPLADAYVEKAFSCRWEVKINTRARLIDVPGMERGLGAAVTLSPIYQKEAGGPITWRARYLRVLPNSR